MTFDVLKVVDGAPVIASSGYLPVGDAATYSGLSVAEIIRAAAASRLSLHCRLSWAQGFVMPIGELGLQPVTKTPAGKYVVKERPPRIPAPDERTDCTYDDSRNGIGEVFLSCELADEILANGLSTAEVQLFQHDHMHVFVCDPPLTVPVERLEVAVDEINALRRRVAAMVSPETVEHARAERRARLTAEQHLARIDMPFSTRATSAGKWASKRFSEAVEAYCTSPDGLQGSLRSHIDQRQRKAGLLVFAEFMGDRMLSEIDGDLLRAFRDGPLKTIPGRINTLPKSIKRDTMRDTIAALQKDGREWPLLSDDMRGERMQWLARFFAWVHQKGYLNTDPSAPLRGETGLTKAEQINRKRRREADDDDEEGREPFDDAQLQLIFSQAHYKTGNGRHVAKPAFWYAFEYWLPLMGLYAGLRLKEASQLHLSDVKQVDGVLCFDINENTPDKSLKNDQSKRIVPVHPELISLGFVSYCERLRGLGYRRVFPELSWSRSNAKYAKESGRKMSAMLEALGMPRNGMLVFHCLRHNANNALARVPAAVLTGSDENLKKLARYALMGHAPGDDVNVRHYTTITTNEKAALLAAAGHALPSITPLDIDFAVEQIALALKKKNAERRGREDMGPLNAVDPAA